MKQQTIRIGTRGSKLALYQAHKVQGTLKEKLPGTEVEIIIIKTKGDKILDTSLSKIGDKGLFTKELETELLNGSIDMAVHSLKDLPTDLPEGLMLGGVLERGDYRDAWISPKAVQYSKLGPGYTVGTSSLRRASQVLAAHPGVKVVDIRGNVKTRIRKMEEGLCDGVIMAAAGLKRLGMGGKITEILPPETLIPATSQGTIAMEIAEANEQAKQACQAINHAETLDKVRAERAFLRHIEGGCQIPAGCYTGGQGDNSFVTGFVASVDGKRMIRHSEKCSGEGLEIAALKVAEQLRKNGGDEILAEIRKT
jgi:hydroxymethylbilane synthase